MSDEAESIKGQIALITGASMGIGEAIALKLAEQGVNIAMVSRSKDKLEAVRAKMHSKGFGVKVQVLPIDIQDYESVDKAVQSVISELGDIDILINNAGLALGAPARFWELDVKQIDQMAGTNINGLMYLTHSVLNRSMWPRKKGTILNVSSVTGLECPPFNGESVYHASKAFLEGFTNSLRMETAESDIKRVKYDKEAMDDFFQGYEPLVADDLAVSVVYMLKTPARIAIKALDCVPTAQRGLTRIDRTWNERHQ